MSYIFNLDLDKSYSKNKKITKWSKRDEETKKVFKQIKNRMFGIQDKMIVVNVDNKQNKKK